MDCLHDTFVGRILIHIEDRKVRFRACREYQELWKRASQAALLVHNMREELHYQARSNAATRRLHNIDDVTRGVGSCLL